jgi:hypothetical protein
MSKNILLAVDAAAHDPVRHVVAAAEMTREPGLPGAALSPRRGRTIGPGPPADDGKWTGMSISRRIATR